jgi:tetratricopeptide (TPR) repeat protein
MSDKETLENNDEEILETEIFSEEDERRKRIIQYAVIALAAVVAIVGGLLFYRYTQDSAEREAALKLSRIRPFYDAGQLEVSLNGVSGTIRGEQVPGLTAIANEYSSVESGRLAALYAGNAFVALERFAEAERYFNIASGSGSDITKMGGLAGLASCKAQAGANAEAAKLYEQASALGAKLGDEDRYKLFAALHFEKAGQKDKALQLFTAIANSTEFSDAITEAKAGIIRLGGTLD